MSIPNFKSNHDWEAFTQIFDSQWHCKRALLNRVKDDMFPGYEWSTLTPYELQYKNECPPCDTLACADHLTDE